MKYLPRCLFDELTNRDVFAGGSFRHLRKACTPTGLEWIEPAVNLSCNGCACVIRTFSNKRLSGGRVLGTVVPVEICGPTSARNHPNSIIGFKSGTKLNPTQGSRHTFWYDRVRVLWCFFENPFFFGSIRFYCSTTTIFRTPIVKDPLSSLLQFSAFLTLYYEVKLWGYSNNPSSITRQM